METAQYSIHAAGLVLHKSTRCCYLADPNGPLMKGGSTEFLQLPFAKLGGYKPTTSYSRWDRDQAEALAQAGPARKRSRTEGSS